MVIAVDVTGLVERGREIVESDLHFLWFGPML